MSDLKFGVVLEHFGLLASWRLSMLASDRGRSFRN